MIIAIDGPASSGKSTTARLVSKKLGFTYIDTGAMYRAMTLKVKEQKIDFTNKDKIISLIPQTTITQKINPEDFTTITLLDERDVSSEIRTPEISKKVGFVCEIPMVREWLVEIQRVLAGKTNVILDGRDIGTVVFPKADLKIWMDASLEIRAKRRFEELVAKNIEITFEEVLKDLEARDQRDASRDASPMKPAEDAIWLDTSKLSIEEQVAEIIKLANQKGK